MILRLLLLYRLPAVIDFGRRTGGGRNFALFRVGRGMVTLGRKQMIRAGIGAICWLQWR